MGRLHGEHAVGRLHRRRHRGDDGYGDQLYAQHHNPFVYFPDLAGDLTTHVKPLTTIAT